MDHSHERIKDAPSIPIDTATGLDQVRLNAYHKGASSSSSTFRSLSVSKEQQGYLIIPALGTENPVPGISYEKQISGGQRYQPQPSGYDISYDKRFRAESTYQQAQNPYGKNSYESGDQDAFIKLDAIANKSNDPIVKSFVEGAKDRLSDLGISSNLGNQLNPAKRDHY